MGKKKYGTTRKKEKGKKMQRKYWVGSMIILLLLVLVVMFFLKNSDKSKNMGNTKIDKTISGITEYILNMSSYEAQLEVTIKSNKNSNTYQMRQQYAKPNIAKQEINSPENIAGLTMLFDGNQLKIENSELSLSTIYENYHYVAQNDLFLNDFVEDYQADTKVKAEEQEGVIILTVKCRNQQNRYTQTKKLYIDQQTAKPIKMEVQDVNQNTLVYILYNEININSIQAKDIVAFKADARWLAI